MDNVLREHSLKLIAKDQEIERIEQANATTAQLKDKEYRDHLNQMQTDHATLLATRENSHQTELRALDAEKTRREIEYLDKIKKMNSEHAAEIKRMQEDALETQRRHDIEIKRL